MNRFALWLIFAAVLFVGCQPAKSPPATDEAAEEHDAAPRQRVLAARDDLFKRLSTRLMEAMSSGGPANAIGVCSNDAPRIAAAVGKEHGLEIGRTSFKLRNPKNAPPEWAAELVEQRVDTAQFVALPEGETGALLPIKLKGQCLACHGLQENIADGVKAKLAELYPEDQATGFKEGDLRGWFWVVAPAAGSEPSE